MSLYTIFATNTKGEKLRLSDMNGSFVPYDASCRARELFRVDDRAKLQITTLLENIISNPVAFGLDSGFVVRLSEFVGSHEVVKEGLSCPRCEAEDLTLSWEGVDSETGKKISVERCGHCHYSHFHLVKND